MKNDWNPSSLRGLLPLPILALAALARAQYDEPSYHTLAIWQGKKFCNCVDEKDTFSGTIPSFTGWLTAAGPCSNDGVAVDWNHYGTSTYCQFSFTPDDGTSYPWAIVYITTSPNVTIPKCTGGQKPVVTYPYNAAPILVVPQGSRSLSGPGA